MLFSVEANSRAVKNTIKHSSNTTAAILFAPGPLLTLLRIFGNAIVAEILGRCGSAEGVERVFQTGGSSSLDGARSLALEG
mmetsp:Transcript_18774/g.52292  ORF Transcript_18774/g.52292 Transcript_18774/m.52292 type:complete len:81 (-) Transcript_18774:137-379(-)|eukprot:CAMPEP_0117657070 /NCGR_PEP_ID=MMETSP0804-20121206/5137_1 /TAXON_ID=1074897 /ORGANISM="Tetraselmis astigmatica, Strain CCMP880" /LENGTH=80 /DNA_ID=CAMNT_0005463505 /DNA_START=794 /DNA_END=1036 /DNA_ORIENTATION=-